MIGIGCDQAGYWLKKEIIKYFESEGIEYVDYGTDSDAATDYPIYAKKVAKAVLDKTVDKGILICGTGIGISITANRYPGIRAALCHDVYSAIATRQHNDANILALGGRVIGVGLALEILKAFLNTPFSEDERHMNRIRQIDEDNA